MSEDSFGPTPRTQLKRRAMREDYSRETIYRILDEALLCHVGFVVDGQPYVIPTSYGRAGDVLYLHGAAANRMLNAMGEGIRVCVSVTLLDGLVLARAAFSHSMNYRSVVIFGSARIVEDASEKMDALRIFTEHIVPGRWNEVRLPTTEELKATMVLALKIEEASSKIRTGPPKDREEDYDLPIWAGQLPFIAAATAPIADLRRNVSLETPGYLSNYKRGTQL